MKKTPAALPDQTTPRRFAELELPTEVAAAIARRGYEIATAVQAAVLDRGLDGRDLLVSSQTGSGKTIAFGMLIGRALVAGGAERRAGARPPRVLVVAPTRELAAQVSRELGWLLSDTGAQVASFTGGTSIGPDLRRLRSGLDVAVGTPGRLVDLHRREALDLRAVEVLVLDEADEMLDLGFKEDLEYLLGNAPKERRTLLFSATIPREIARLAAAHQRDAARIDPRPAGATEANADITYVAHLVRPRDRLAAVVNVLLAGGDAKAIVFCRTREGVGELHHRLVEHGFRATAIAGDRAQGERDRALEAVRHGRAQILVATNVAARGLDLPDVDLVVHADLPENGEALTHRSGRTGRAGKKGTAVVIAELADRRKAERLLAAVRREPVRWTPAPSEADVRRVAHERIVSLLVEEARAAQGTGEIGSAPNGDPAADDADGLGALADRVRAVLPERVLLPLLLKRELERLPAPLPIEPVDTERRDRRLAGSARPRFNERPQPEAEGDGRRRAWTRAVIFRVNLGADANAEPGWLLPLICRRGGVTRKEVGAIRVGPRSSTFEIAAEAADEFALSASRTDPRAPHVQIEPAHGAMAPATGPRPPRPERGEGPRRGPRPDRGFGPPRPHKGPKGPRRTEPRRG